MHFLKLSVLLFIPVISWADCITKFESLYEDGKGSMPSVEVKKLEKDCMDSGYYEVMLAQSLIRERNFEDAKHMVEKALRKDGPQRNTLLRVKVDIDYYRMLVDENVHDISWENVIDRYNELVSSKGIKNDVIIFLRLAEAQLEIKKYNESISNIRKALRFEEHPRFYSILVMGASATGDYPTMDNAFEKAFSLNPNVFEEIDTMCYLSQGYADHGQYLLSRNALVKLIEVNPSAASSAYFINAVEYLKQALIDSGYN